MHQCTNNQVIKGVLFILFLFIFSFSYSQVNTGKWETQGNIADSFSFIGTKNNVCLRFRSNNLERMRITDDGNVGIGLLNPTKKFEVNGSSLIKGNLFLPSLDTITNIQSNKLLFIDENGKIIKGGLDKLKTVIFGEPVEPGPVPIEPCDFGVLQQNPTWYSEPYKLYTLCPDIKVGIGTKTPNYTLDVNGWARIKGKTLTRRLKVGKKTSEKGLITGYYKGGLRTYNLISLGIYNPQNNATTPILTLDAKGNLELNNKDKLIFSVDNEGNLKLNNNNKLIFSIDDKGNLKLSNEDKLIFFVDAENTTPTLRARRIVVDQHTWSDYVFHKNYRLPALLEVEDYIDENGHLPDVPSEREVLENGVDVAEMNSILLKKIEELTLYVIQQQKEIEKLKKSR